MNLFKLLQQDAAESSKHPLGFYFFFYPLFWMLHSVCNDRSVLWRTETALSMGQQLVFCKSCLLWENMCDHWQPLKVQLEQHNWDCYGIWHALIKRRAHPTVRSLRTAGDGNVKGDNLKMWRKKKVFFKIVVVEACLQGNQPTNQPSLNLCSIVKGTLKWFSIVLP